MITKFANVPTIDVSPLFGDDSKAKKLVAVQIDEACRDTGFFFSKNHGVDCLKEFFDTVHRFHQNITDEERKRMAIVAYEPTHTDHVVTGYYLPIEGKKAVQSFYIQNPSFNPEHPLIKAGTPLHEVNIWPNEAKHPGFRKLIESYYWKAFEFSSVLLRGFALALGKEERFFDRYFKKEDTMSSMRLIRYPYIDPYPQGAIKTAFDGEKLSFETHTDVSLLTVLYQPHVANLQVNTSDGYQNIPASDDCFLVNGGLFLARITSDYYKAPLHRVKYVNAERLSLPFFVHLANDSVIEGTHPNDPNAPPSYPTISYGRFFQEERLVLIKKNGQT
jgi:isopenicillin-N synthase